MEITKAFKIVEACGGELFSLVATGVALVKYIPNEWSYPPKELSDCGNRLCVFESLKDATDFIHPSSLKYGVDQIWECDAEGISGPTGVFLNPEVFVDTEECSEDDMNMILASMAMKKKCEFLWANNTRMADAVRLTRRVTWEEIVEAEPWVEAI